MKNKLNKIAKSVAALSLCMLVAFPLVACSGDKNSQKEVSTTELKNFLDVRTAKIINLQSAILKFTTENKAGSISSVKLEPVDGKYIYTVDALTKKNQNVILTIDASTGNITNTEDKGVADTEKKLNLIDFVPVLDVDKAAKYAVAKSKNNNIQVLSYKLYSKGSINIYEFELSDGSSNGKQTSAENSSENKDNSEAKNEVIYINAVTGKSVDPATLNSSSPSTSTSTSESTTNSSTSSTTESTGSVE